MPIDKQGWAAARARVPAQRSTSRAALAVDVMAAAPLLSATTLAKAIGMSIKCAGELLERFVAEGIAVEVTHRSARRLFGLLEMARCATSHRRQGGRCLGVAVAGRPSSGTGRHKSLRRRHHSP